MDPALVGAAHDRCLAIHPYTLEEKTEMRNLVGLGVDGMFTNFPNRLNEVLAEVPGKETLDADLAAARAADPPESEPSGTGPSETEQTVSLQARELLENWRSVPGTADDGTIDAGELDAWVSQARLKATARGRARAADRRIGRVLAFSPAGADGAWPHEAVRAVVERVQSV